MVAETATSTVEPNTAGPCAVNWPFTALDPSTVLDPIVIVIFYFKQKVKKVKMKNS
jgi:hypothetical protein